MPDKRRMPGFVRGLPETRKAIAYARRMHRGQRRAVDGAPFIEHPLEVASLLYYAGAADHVIAAGALHDTLEKSDATVGGLTERFGTAVVAIVCAVSEDPRIADYEQRKAALRAQVGDAGRDALMVFAADKLSKLRELRLGTGGAESLADRMHHYSESVVLLSERLPQSPLVAAAQRELETLAPAPRHAA